MNLLERLIALTDGKTGEICVSVKRADRPVRYAKEEEVRDLYLHTYPEKTSEPLGNSDDWALFHRWVLTLDSEKLGRFVEDGCSDPAGNAEGVQALRRELVEALDHIDPDEGIGGTVHRIGKQLVDTMGETVEGVLVSDKA